MKIKKYINQKYFCDSISHGLICSKIMDKSQLKIGYVVYLLPNGDYVCRPPLTDIELVVNRLLNRNYISLGYIIDITKSSVFFDTGLLINED